MEPFIQEKEKVLSIKKWQERIPGLIAGFSLRNGGVSAQPFDSLNIGLHVNDDKKHVLMNRKLLVGDLSFSMNDWVSGEQVHGTNVKQLDADAKGSGAYSQADAIPDTDGLITNEKGMLCTALFADCVPLFFCDPKTEYIGIAHAGWKGTVNGIGAKMIAGLKARGAAAENIEVVIGPCISAPYYEVDEHVVRHIAPKYRARSVVPQGTDRYLLDLKQFNVDILLQAGVLRNNIDITNYCTYREKALFFSHRRDEGKTGRMAGFIGFLL